MSRGDMAVVLLDHLHAGAHLRGQCVVIHAVFQQGRVGVGVSYYLISPMHETLAT
jgi:hypothetical protein